MYHILKVSLRNGSSILWKKCPDPGMAFELATILHAATMGLCEDQRLNEEHQGAYTSHITTSDGKSAWEECSLARCPSFNGLLN